MDDPNMHKYDASNNAEALVERLQARVAELERERNLILATLPDDYTESKDWAFDKAPVLRIEWLKSRIDNLKQERSLQDEQLDTLRKQEPVAFEDWCQKVCDNIESDLLNHKLSSLACDEDGSDGYPLLDHLSTGNNTETGLHEVTMIVETIYFAIKRTGPPLYTQATYTKEK